jgi:hypothetical protein
MLQPYKGFFISGKAGLVHAFSAESYVAEREGAPSSCPPDEGKAAEHSNNGESHGGKDIKPR